MKYWFTSDNHFGQKSILKNSRRGELASNIEELNALMESVWNAQVAPKDVVYVIGDFSFMSTQKTADLLDRLHGTKRLVYGNHDDHLRERATLRGKFEWCKDLNTERFHIPERFRETDEDTVKTVKVVMCHFPVYAWRDMKYGAFHLHGHLHSLPGVRTIPGRAMDVGLEGRPNNDLKLWSWEEIYEILIQREVRDHHGSD